MKPRERVIPTSKLTEKCYDQRTIPDFRTPGTNDPISQYKLSKTPNDANAKYRKANHKHFPLRNGVPYVPIVKAMEARGAINLFDPTQFTVPYALAQVKQPEDSLIRARHLSKVLKVTEKMGLTESLNAKRDRVDPSNRMNPMIRDNLDLQEQFFLSDRRKHDELKHKVDRHKNGLVELNAFENTKKILNMLNELKAKETRAPGQISDF